jgi:hypothetical protein
MLMIKTMNKDNEGEDDEDDRWEQEEEDNFLIALLDHGYSTASRWSQFKSVPFQSVMAAWSA